jgi:hypothetical protein
MTPNSRTTKKVAALLYPYCQTSADKFLFLFFKISTTAAETDHNSTAEQKMTEG